MDASRPGAYTIRPMDPADLPLVTGWARQEGFCPGPGDLAILRRADRTGVWVGCLAGEPIGCIIGVRWDRRYGFIGLFLVRPEHRGHGYGVALWRRALEHLADVACIGLEAAPERVADYAGWGFRPAWDTLRWTLPAAPARPACAAVPLAAGHRLLPAAAVPEAVVQAYDARHAATPRPHFLREWLRPREGEAAGDDPAVLVVLDRAGACRGFARIRPCLLAPAGAEASPGWRLGPWLADDGALAGALLAGLCGGRPGPVLVDAPEANPAAHRLLEQRGFRPTGRTVRMYRGAPPQLPIGDVYGLACLE
ncbi:MAG: GNAT family N-acetyltransferase, partial [Synechococcaceae cyanobacterium]|nr:GNAT family N-acetyltransferase [Synechococcaceae cyanobacterium]